MSRPLGNPRRARSAAGVAVPADKRFRRSDLRPDRRRLGRTLRRVGRWVVPIAVLVVSASWLVNAMLGARVLAVEQVVVHGTRRLSPGEVQAMIPGLRGENIFRVDFGQYRHSLMASPWVADVMFGRILPSTVEIRVVERTPLAIARLGQQLYLVDDTGVIIDEYGAPYRDLDLPIVDGLVSSPATAGPLVDRDRIRLTSALVSALASRPELRRRLSQVDVSNARDAVVMFDHDSAWLHLGDDHFAERLTTYLELAPSLAHQFPAVDYVDLRFDERVFIRPAARSAEASRDGRGIAPPDRVDAGIASRRIVE